ncbi:MAG TPA: ankyrin repeat domain-containing protein [Candidatus Bathyarchaeia archaeon]|nr:ankyrin repeat domain-containing protein [Candidatus Bathyarchaeia archaeon]
MKKIELCMFTIVIAMVQNVFSMDWEGETGPMKTVEEGVKLDKSDMIFEGLKAGAPINLVIDKEGNTLLHYFLDKAVKSYEEGKYKEMQKEIHRDIKRLLKYKPDVNVQNYRGETPLHCAALVDDKKIIKMLLKKGADKELEDDRGFMPYEIAEDNGLDDIVKLLKNLKIEE